MRIKIKMKRGGIVKSVPDQHAKILVKMGKAEYYEEPQPEKKPPVEKAQKVVIKAPENKALIADIDAEEEPKKKPGRPKKNTYETKVLTAEE